MRYDVVIIGAGPAGCVAGLYAGRARLKTLVLEKLGEGGQLLNYSKVENYPGFPEGIEAFQLASRFSEQMKLFGAELANKTVLAIKDIDKKIKKVITDKEEIEAKAIIIATGATPKSLGVKGEKEYLGKGVSFCAVCDGPFFRDQDVAVVGGGDSALEEALYLTKFARRVFLIHRRDKFRATKVLQDKVAQTPTISVVLNTVVKEIVGGQDAVEGLVLHNLKEDKYSELPVKGVFLFIGMEPNTGFLPEDIKKDEQGFIITNERMETSVRGVYAAGDVRSKPLRQIVTAVSDGAIAAFSANQYIEEGEEQFHS